VNSYDAPGVDFLVLGVLILIPAVIVFIIMTAVRRRRSSFHRQRITKKSIKK
jgi:hypothetical protein